MNPSAGRHRMIATGQGEPLNITTADTTLLLKCATLLFDFTQVHGEVHLPHEPGGPCLSQDAQEAQRIARGMLQAGLALVAFTRAQLLCMHRTVGTTARLCEVLPEAERGELLQHYEIPVADLWVLNQKLRAVKKALEGCAPAGMPA